jgi:ribosomal protein S18 acetylase RimI-like enzyme
MTETIQFEEKPDRKELAKFFVENVDTTYISHSEMQQGLATSDGKHWASDLLDQLETEFSLAAYRPKRRLVTLRQVGRLVGMIWLQLEEMLGYAVLDDVVVAKAHREEGVGARMLEWLEEKLGEDGIFDLYLESGAQNYRAHSFFESQGYKTVSRVMLKQLKGPHE